MATAVSEKSESPVAASTPVPSVALSDVSPSEAQAPDGAPVPLSFPAILRSAKLADRFAHLRVHERPVPSKTSLSKARRNEHEGKRWIRRRENANFTHNPHITPPSHNDYTLPVPSKTPTFPTPLPPYLPRSSMLPPSVPGIRDPSSSTAGLFSISLKGTRRALRTRPGVRDIVGGIEGHLCAWLEGGTYPGEDGGMDFPGEKVGGREDVREVSRGPEGLVWVIGKDGKAGDGAFERYVVHCVARWHGIISFSKEMDSRRLTYLLRPRTARSTLDTPPATDGSQVDTESELLSDVESDFVFDEEDGGDISAMSEAGSSRVAWSVIGERDLELDEGFAASIESLALDADEQREPRAVYRTGFSSRWSGTSPSRTRSPIAAGIRDSKAGKETFYNYLFA